MGLLNIFKKAKSNPQQNAFETIIDEALKEAQSKNIFAYMVKPGDVEVTKTIMNLPDKEKVNFIISSVKTLSNTFKDGNSVGGTTYDKTRLWELYLSYLIRTKFVIQPEDVEAITDVFISFKWMKWSDVTHWPLNAFVTLIERNFKSAGIPQKVKDSLMVLKSEIAKLKRTDKDTLKLVAKIDALLFESENKKNEVKPTLFLGKDTFTTYANNIVEQRLAAEKIIWYKLISHSQKASGSKPSARYIEQSKLLVKELGSDKFKKVIIDWFDFVVRLKETVHQHTNTYNGRVYNYNSYEFLNGPTIETLKGFVWICSQFYDSRTLQTVAALAERSFKKIPGRGPAAAAMGNACLYTLYKSKGLEGIAHLSRLKLRIKQSSTQTLIEKYLQEAAKVEGISVMEIEDLAVDDYGLINGKREYEIEDYKAIVKIYGISDVRVDWFKPDNSPQKSVPSIVKEKHKDRLKKITGVAKQIQVSLSVQRDRLDRMLRSNRKMSWNYFDKHYFSHGLLSYLTKDILWEFSKEDKVSTCIYLNDTWTALDSEKVIPDDSYHVSIWHPVTGGLNEIRSWREFLMREKIQQPIKQAFREVYLITDAEVNTRTYSNRMAAHILKQHQFNSLAKTRGWKYSLLGAYDDGRYNEGALLNFSEENLRAEFWVNEVNSDDAFNEAGIWNYISTDQVRFVSLETNNPLELINIPPIIFSEVMRDVDLFVGVSSVGNDPNWQDNGGIPAYRDYWQSYSFGELTEIAKTRKEILENLVPRLKIGPVASIKDRYLVIRGKKRTYKIHLGSTNILMEPNDQYLCIVPDRSKKDTTSNVFLPFEGDTGLSVILSKALLLAEDDKITDPTITSQIDRK